MAYQEQDRYKLQYFTGVQASIWIGEAWVTETFGISFSATQNIVPIFGYASSTFDAIARGKVLVQGSFEINFVDEGYLYYVMHKMNASRLDGDPESKANSQHQIDGQYQAAKTKAHARIREIEESGKRAALNAGYGREDEDKVAAQVIQDLEELTLAQFDQLERDLNYDRARGKKAGERNSASSVIYDVIPFNIRGIFGNPAYTDEVTEKKLMNCFLVSNEMVVSSDDQPLRERYSFIGQFHK
jgi:hypothetical protein